MQLLSLGKGAGGTGKQDQYDSWFQQRHQWQGYKHRDGLKKFQGAVRSDCRHGEVFLKFHTKDKEISGSIAVDGYISSLSSLFGCMPITSFSQNVGLIAMTHVVNRKAIASGAVIMILAGLFPGRVVILASLPDAVLGGCTLMMFGSIVVSGVHMLSQCGYSERNMTIAALSLSVGLGFTQTPQIFHIFPPLFKSVFAENCVAVVFLVSLVLSFILPKDKPKAEQ